MNEPLWVEVRDVLVLHERLLALHGGAAGLRDAGLLESALARPQQLYAYADAPDGLALAAACTVGLVRNHPFIDGNKRVGFIIGVLFLELNGYRFTADEAEAAQAVLALAAGTLDEAGYTHFLRANSQHSTLQP